MKKIRKIKRRCKCGCGGITNPGRIYTGRHNLRGRKHSVKTRLKISSARMGIKLSKKHKKNLSLALMGNTNCLGRKYSKETKKKMPIWQIKYNPNYKYCDIWKDREYRKDLRKDYCENKDCESNYKRLNNHHAYLNKKQCAPDEVMTLCNSCHMVLHRNLEEEWHMPVNPKDYIIINRLDHISYICKATHKIIRINKK